MPPPTMHVGNESAADDATRSGSKSKLLGSAMVFSDSVELAVRAYGFGRYKMTSS